MIHVSGFWVGIRKCVKRSETVVWAPEYDGKLCENLRDERGEEGE